MEKKEEIMKPRIKIVNPWPYMPHGVKVGDIITLKEYSSGTHWVHYNGLHFDEENITQFPANIQVLEWWEEREESEMPEYVKWPVDGQVYFAKLTRKRNAESYEVIFDNSEGTIEFDKDDQPATKEDFEAYQSLKPNQK